MNIQKKLEKYLQEHLEGRKTLFQKYRVIEDACCQAEVSFGSQASSDINQYIQENKEETFQSKLFTLIDSRNLKDSDVYNKVDIDRRLFSKIRSNKDYHPSKETVILLGIALELSEKEMEDLLESASYSLPMNTTFDLIIRFCLKEKIYNLNQINEFLYEHKCKILSDNLSV